MNDSVFQAKSSFQYRYEDIERDNKKLKAQLMEANQKIIDISKQNSNLDLRYKDSLRELEMVKHNIPLVSMTAKESLEVE